MINIRLAKPSDAKYYANILNRSWKDTYGEYISEEHIDNEFNIEKLINNFEGYIDNGEAELYIIEYDEKAVGIIELGNYEDKYKEDMDGIGEIRSLHIKQDFQKLGIGKSALSFGINRLKELGYKTCCLWVKKQNKNAIEFYLKNGFVKTEYSCEETVDGAPSFVMEKSL